MLFVDRHDAGRQLAGTLAELDLDPRSAVVLGLPRGGVPVAYEVAKALDLPLDVFLVRKIGLPTQPELAIGAIATGGVRVFNGEMIRESGITEADIAAVVAYEERELARREGLYRGDERPIDAKGKTVILVDDGLATGASMFAAVTALRAHDPARIIVAVPVASSEACADLRRVADVVVCVETPEPFRAVGVWYHDFSQTTDQEVRALLAAARVNVPAASAVEK
ncbi:MAG TPA: phosphoribosyltransferase [Gemmatimonadaceae bacterium]|jgi:predicted phosphoribosyltransferase|nr:phosphoribosyltransferase [Gemmatimonadaceae bacterium]